MKQLLDKVHANQPKKNLPQITSGDTVKVYQRIQEGGKQRTQVFEGIVIALKRAESNSATILVRRIASGVGVEKSFRLNSPTVEKVVVMKRSRARRNRLNYMRQRQGKSAKLAGVYAGVDDLAEQEAGQQPATSTQDSAPSEDETETPTKEVAEDQSKSDQPNKKSEPKTPVEAPTAEVTEGKQTPDAE